MSAISVSIAGIEKSEVAAEFASPSEPVSVDEEDEELLLDDELAVLDDELPDAVVDAWPLVPDGTAAGLDELPPPPPQAAIRAMLDKRSKSRVCAIITLVLVKKFLEKKGERVSLFPPDLRFDIKMISKIILANKD